jgi:hypothetical protein
VFRKIEMQSIDAQPDKRVISSRNKAASDSGNPSLCGIDHNTGNWQLATGNWQLATGNWQLATGNWQLATGNCQRYRSA